MHRTVCQGFSETQAGWVVPSQHQIRTGEGDCSLTLNSDERHHYICTTFTPERCNPPIPPSSLPNKTQCRIFKPRRNRNKKEESRKFFHIHKSDGLSMSKLVGGKNSYCLKKKKIPARLNKSTRLWLECTTGEKNKNVKAVHENRTRFIFGNTKE